MNDDRVALGEWLEACIPAAMQRALPAQPGCTLWADGKRLRTRQVSAERTDGGVLRRFRAPDADLEIEQLI